MAELSISNSPPPPGPELWIKRLRAGEQLRCTILSDELWGVHYHWSGKVSMPHTLPGNECVGCNHQYPLKWHGYFHVQAWPNGRQFFLELTPFAYRQVEEKSMLVSGWRGTRFQFQRGKGDNTRLSVDFMGPPLEKVQLPAARTPETELRALWGLAAPGKNGSGTLPGVDVGHWI